MDPYHRFHHRFLNKRQGLGGVVSDLIPGGSTSSATSQAAASSASSQTSSDPLALSGIIGGLTSVVSDVTSSSSPSSAPFSTTTSTTPLTLSSSSSAGSTTPPTSTSTSSSTSTSISSTSPTPEATKPTPTPSASNVVFTSSDGTSIVYVTSTPPAASTTAASAKSFLQNPSVEGPVFAAVGIVVLILLFVIVTCTIRKRRRDRLERDLAAAVTFDPGATDLYERQERSTEKHRLSGSSSGHGHGYGHGPVMPQPAYAPPQEYHGVPGYGQYPVAAYHGPSANPILYQATPPPVPQPTGQGGANLTRKFSDRKPVPPLFPDPVYDPANAHVTVAPQVYQQ